MNNSFTQGLKLILLVACIVSANFIVTRPVQDGVAKELRPQPLLTVH